MKGKRGNEKEGKYERSAGEKEKLEGKYEGSGGGK